MSSWALTEHVGNLFWGTEHLSGTKYSIKVKHFSDNVQKPSFRPLASDHNWSLSLCYSILVGI